MTLSPKLKGRLCIPARLLRTAEMAAFTGSFRGRRQYLFAPLLGDVIILTARTMTKWDGRFANASGGVPLQ
jgi:hypothetical protein